ncbi:MAG: cysteine synthase A [Firmicutes bacterium]|nr:cysteine synthase A [Bacillota bacterium]MDH7496130.1 cysteine synthase A [Bacillota bacterium]
MARIVESVQEIVGKTPLVRIRRMADGLGVQIAAKLEFMNPGGSVKDRAALGMLIAAEREGRLGPGSVVVEPTSGNTGIALAMLCASRGLRLIVTMPESMSVERLRILEAYGASVILTPAEEGMDGAVRRAGEIASSTPGSIVLQQFSNPANPEAHRKTTAREIWEDTDGQVDVLVAGVGTGGTVTGVGEALKAKKPCVRVVAVEPAESRVLEGGPPGHHGIQGIGAGFVPPVLNVGVIDEVVAVATIDAILMAKRLAREEGILAGVSSGAALAAALRVAGRPESRGRLIVVVFPDGGESYLSGSN